MYRCERCGKELPLDSDFCPECGMTINKEEISNENTKMSLRAALVGKKADHYIPIFEELDHDKRQSWNWCAFFVSPMWFAYRKMYGWSAIAIFTPLILGFILGIGLVYASISELALELIAQAFGLAFNIVFAVISNNVYKKRIDKLISEMPEDEDAKAKYIAKKGGVNSLGVIFAIIVYIGLYVVL